PRPRHGRRQPRCFSAKPPRVKQSHLLLVVAALPFFATRIFAGCSNQGEGQLCSVLNSQDGDCQDGLICTAKIGYMACCPPSGSTQPACMGNGNMGASSSTGTGGTGTGGSGTGGSGTGGSGTGGSGTGGSGTGGSGTGGSGTGGSMLDGGGGG